MTSRLTDERIAEIERLAIALLPRGDRLVFFEVADIVRELRDACKDLLAEVKALRAEKESTAEEYSQRLSHAIDDYYNAWANQQVEVELLKKQLTQAEAEAEKKQSHLEFLRAELATVNDILATISESDAVGRMSFEGRKTKIEAELQQTEKQGEQE